MNFLYPLCLTQVKISSTSLTLVQAVIHIAAAAIHNATNALPLLQKPDLEKSGLVSGSILLAGYSNGQPSPAHHQP